MTRDRKELRQWDPWHKCRGDKDRGLQRNLGTSFSGRKL